ncbi:MAG: hypothetical protein HZA54_05735 [Planctomycetes bacterium]|nr:hypothetical protein [Planctomycetota bacterium]
MGPAGRWQDCAPFSVRLPLDRGHPVPRYPRSGLGALYLLTGPLACVNPLPADGPQRFSLLITNVDGDGLLAAAGCWKTSALANGECTVEVVARDHAGNEARAELRVRIANPDDSGPK